MSNCPNSGWNSPGLHRMNPADFRCSTTKMFLVLGEIFTNIWSIAVNFATDVFKMPNFSDQLTFQLAP